MLGHAICGSVFLFSFLLSFHFTLFCLEAACRPRNSIAFNKILFLFRKYYKGDIFNHQSHLAGVVNVKESDSKVKNDKLKHIEHIQTKKYLFLDLFNFVKRISSSRTEDLI